MIFLLKEYKSIYLNQLEICQRARHKSIVILSKKSNKMGNKLVKKQSRSKDKKEEPPNVEMLEEPCTPWHPLKTAKEVDEETRALLESASQKLQTVKERLRVDQDALLKAIANLQLK